MKSVRLIIHGRVQGVFFRQHTLEKARELGLSGSVRNCSDGTVEAFLEGPEQQTALMIAWCHKGPPRARVDRVDIHEVPLKNFSDFRILKA